MTLASAGRANVKLWDIASGKFLLDVDAGNYVTALAFSPEGRKLAVGSIAAFGDADSVNVWELEPGRGIGSLRGLSRCVIKTILSPDGRLVAALSNDWHVGVSDRATHRLIQVLEVTPGSFTDNAALAFSSDGRRLAYSAGREASLWDVATGEPIKTWRLAEGLSDRLAFAEANRLLLFRVETETGRGDQDRSGRSTRRNVSPRLPGAGPARPLTPSGRSRRSGTATCMSFTSACSPDGKYYVVGEGPGRLARASVTRIANLYEGPTGRELGTLPAQTPINLQGGASFGFDTTGTVLNFAYLARERRTFFLDMPSRAILRQFDEFPQCLGPRAKRWLMNSRATADQPQALTLFEQDRPEPLVKFVLDLGNAAGIGRPQFSPDGLHLVWGNPSGGVTVVDLVEVNRRLSELGLGW